jgi:hypothetical protein
MKPRSFAVVLVAVLVVLTLAFSMRGRGHAFMRHLGAAIHGH